ncbi:class III signal peptide-containing protein [Adlercreutzia mucosicola]|jgi:Flp pilus assembly pilin Flp|uniref:class III signal peptide-containing protein n=1 Tax=Adlercreutzia mucosicola TaxID=580026 RepID=UPI0003F8849F|nr:class III signal peptide-containing protein [Adlercreutzia mucosicola]MCR2035199.1 class III signal peptide-containing protein [Adlercreutzia mucosicola]MEB1814435.1 class III signal peptide-containing protein [Adlercreutzia mucosicola]
MNVYTATKGLVNRGRKGVLRRIQGGWARLSAKLSCARGQGTTEYAILVGVLVVIAIIAITLFRPKLQELWDAIAAGINGL